MFRQRQRGDNIMPALGTLLSKVDSRQLSTALRDLSKRRDTEQMANLVGWFGWDGGSIDRSPLGGQATTPRCHPPSAASLDCPRSPPGLPTRQLSFVRTRRSSTSSGRFRSRIPALCS